MFGGRIERVLQWQARTPCIQDGRLARVLGLGRSLLRQTVRFVKRMWMFLAIIGTVVPVTAWLLLLLMSDLMKKPSSLQSRLRLIGQDLETDFSRSEIGILGDFVL